MKTKTSEKNKNEDLGFVLEKIKTAYSNTPPGEFVEIEIDSNQKRTTEAISLGEFQKVLKSLEKLRAIRIEYETNFKSSESSNKIIICVKTLEPKFSEVYNKFIKEKNKKLYWVKYNKIREITINEKYLIKKPQSNRPSDSFFTYLYEHSDKAIKKSELPNDIFSGTRKNHTLHKLVNRIGFNGELRKCFFDVSKSSIIFTKEVNKNDLEKRGIDIKKLEKQLNKLEKIS